jgi:endonuclease III
MSILVCTLNTKDSHVGELFRDFFHVFPMLMSILGDIVGAFQMLQKHVNYRNKKAHYVIGIVKTIYKRYCKDNLGRTWSAKDLEAFEPTDHLLEKAPNPFPEKLLKLVGNMDNTVDFFPKMYDEQWIRGMRSIGDKCLYVAAYYIYGLDLQVPTDRHSQRYLISFGLALRGQSDPMIGKIGGQNLLPGCRILVNNLSTGIDQVLSNPHCPSYFVPQILNISKVHGVYHPMQCYLASEGHYNKIVDYLQSDLASQMEIV